MDAIVVAPESDEIFAHCLRVHGINEHDSLCELELWRSRLRLRSFAVVEIDKLAKWETRIGFLRVGFYVDAVQKEHCRRRRRLRL